MLDEVNQFYLIKQVFEEFRNIRYVKYVKILLNHSFLLRTKQLDANSKQARAEHQSMHDESRMRIEELRFFATPALENNGK